MQIAQQFSIFMVNKPGVLSQVLDTFAKEKINIVAMTMMDSAEHGVMRVVFGGSKRAEAVLAGLNMPYNQTEVLCLGLDNKAGALAEVAERLARNHINIAYAYVTAGARGGKTTGVFKVANVKKAMKVLEQRSGKKASKAGKGVRRSPASKQ